MSWRALTTAKHTWERNADGTFKVFRDGVVYFDEHENCYKHHVDIESLEADDIIQLPHGTIMAKKGDAYSLYATEKFLVRSERRYGDVVKFIDGILEYRSFGDAILFKTAEGWFFLFISYSFLDMDKEGELERRVKQVTKLCEADAQILECKCIKLAPMDHNSNQNGYMVTTSEGNFLLYSEYYTSGYAIPIARYGEIPGYSWNVKIYPNTGRKFFLAPLHSDFCYRKCRWYKPDLFQSVTYLGDGYMLAKNGKKNKLLFCEDGIPPRTVVDWGNHVITKVESEYDEIRDEVCTKWSIADGKSTQIVEEKVRLKWCTIPEKR